MVPDPQPGVLLPRLAHGVRQAGLALPGSGGGRGGAVLPGHGAAVAGACRRACWCSSDKDGMRIVHPSPPAARITRVSLAIWQIRLQVLSGLFYLCLRMANRKRSLPTLPEDSADVLAAEFPALSLSDRQT